MSKSAPAPAATPATLAANTAAYVGHTHIRLRGEQTGTICACMARTPNAKVTVGLGTVLMTFWSAAAAQGLLEALSAAQPLLVSLPDAVPAVADPYGVLAIAIDWTSRPTYAVVPHSRLRDDQRRTLRWIDIHTGPVTFQLLDRAAHRSLTTLLREVHRTAVGVCLDGAAHSADPTDDDYTPAELGPPRR